MYLKALEIQGFKSFPDKTTLTFDDNITAIVGPNGSGKSNISDALLWVMGEQRSKTLRGAKMEDVIFGGTEKRGAMGFAQVSLILDNSNHVFDYDSSEIMLTRRYYRSGESEYYINREVVRLKDINSLLMDTGLGRDGYSIIGQGRISEIVSTKSQDRREVFEEAAGISRYRYRKEEAERKLEKTDDNLLRINDKVEELELQVGPLKEQSEVAKKYLKLRDEMKEKEISVWMETLDKLHENASVINSDYETAQKQLDEARREMDALHSSSEDLLEKMHGKDIEAEEVRTKLSENEQRVAELEAEAAVLRTNIKNSEESAQRMRNDISEAEKRANEVRNNIRDNETHVVELDKQINDINDKLKSSQNIIAGCRLKAQSREKVVDELNDKATKLSIDCRSMDSRIEMLSAMEKDYEGFSKAVKTIMKEAGHGVLKGVHGPVANLVQTTNEFALAIETALGASLQNIVVDTQTDGRNAIELLKKQDSGRATLLPLDMIQGEVMKNPPENDPGYVGLAFDLAKFDSKYEMIFANLLGRTVVAENLSYAVKMSKASNGKLRIVTLDGQLINAGGSMTGGSAAKGTGIISRANELKDLKAQRLKLEQQNSDCVSKLEAARTELAGINYQLSMAIDDENSINRELSGVESEKRAIKSNINQLEILLNAMSGDSKTRLKAIDDVINQAKEYEKQLSNKQTKIDEFKKKSENYKAEIVKINNSKIELEGKRNKADKEVYERNSDIINLERTVGKLEQKKLAADMEEKQILDKLWDNYELSHTDAQNIRKPIESLNKANREINDLRKEINSLGSPNLGAIDEYARVSERYEFLTGQRDDVLKAKKDLVSIIADITSEMQEVFLREFKAIDTNFRETFLELFGGGKAQLILEDETDPLECGIEIKVQPPGKALSSLTLLSGGEMAFVAIALYFAIIKVRPTPFCVMDEIEAALDEANVNRYAEYMRKMSSRTQFIVITHRRGTMEEADHLYGVTMQEKGVSKVISLNLAEAQKTIETAKR